MRNILVSKNYQVQDHSKWYGNRTHEKDIATNYNAMEQIMTDSARAYLQDLDHVVIHRGEAATIRDVFRIHFREIHSLWQSEPCNILYCDLDVVFIKPTEIFNQFQHFSMFNLTNPSRTLDKHYGVTFNHYYNCGVRYYPHNMTKQVWDVGLQMLQNWNPDRWDAEQVIYNQMMWSQGLPHAEFYRPELAYQLLNADLASNQNTSFNRMSVSDARVVHVHGSRGSSNRLESMAKLWMTSNMSMS